MDTVVITGTCLQMCPEEEIKMRERERLLHRLEMVVGTEKHRVPKADRQKIVKCFSRSAAGREMRKKEQLRPPEVLLKTVTYLLKSTVCNEKYPWHIRYDFIMDRLHAVRQDIVIQSLPKAPTICLLQPIVRFYALSAYKLCEEPIEIFDPSIHQKHLQECLKKLLGLYSDCESFKSKCEQMNKNLDECSSVYANSRSEIEALYIVHNLGDPDAIRRGLSLPKLWRSSDTDMAIKMSLNYLKGNYVAVCKLMKLLSPLLACSAILHLPIIRKKSFEVMSIAYNSKNLWFPLETLKTYLLYSKIEDLYSDLEYYNIICDKNERKVQFRKGEMHKGETNIKPRHELFVDDKLRRFTIPSLILYE